MSRLIGAAFASLAALAFAAPAHADGFPERRSAPKPPAVKHKPKPHKPAAKPHKPAHHHGYSAGASAVQVQSYHYDSGWVPVAPQPQAFAGYPGHGAYERYTDSGWVSGGTGAAEYPGVDIYGYRAAPWGYDAYESYKVRAPRPPRVPPAPPAYEPAPLPPHPVAQHCPHPGAVVCFPAVHNGPVTYVPSQPYGHGYSHGHEHGHGYGHDVSLPYGGAYTLDGGVGGDLTYGAYGSGGGGAVFYGSGFGGGFAGSSASAQASARASAYAASVSRGGHGGKKGGHGKGGCCKGGGGKH